MAYFTYSDIPQSVLASLIDYRGGLAGSLCPRPLMGEAVTITRQMMAELYGGEFIDLNDVGQFSFTDDFNSVLDVLIEPKTNISLRIWGEGGRCSETSMLFPHDIGSGNGITLNQFDKNYRISAPIGIEDVTKLLRQSIPPASLTNPIEFEGNFDPVIGIVLFGLCDLYKKKNAVNSTDLYGYIDGQWGLTGFDSLLSFLMPMVNKPAPPLQVEIEFALQNLLDTGIISANDDNYSLSANLQSLVKLFPKEYSGLQWQKVILENNKNCIYSHRIFLYCENGQILSLSPSLAGRIHVSLIDQEQMVEYLIDEITYIHSDPVSGDVSKKVTEEDLLKLIGEMTVNPQKNSCPKCGTKIASNKKFCTNCGAKMNKEL